MPRLRPAGGFSIDPALVYALTRLESNFDTAAISRAGARGLMQIMPATAQYITGDLVYAPERLHEPASTSQIGQRYIAYLARQDGIDNDLMRCLPVTIPAPEIFCAGAPKSTTDGDPLLFIEAIPVPETRTFVPHVLVIRGSMPPGCTYRPPAWTTLAAGEFPRFTPPEHERRMALSGAGAH